MMFNDDDDGWLNGKTTGNSLCLHIPVYLGVAKSVALRAIFNVRAYGHMRTTRTHFT